MIRKPKTSKQDGTPPVTPLRQLTAAIAEHLAALEGVMRDTQGPQPMADVLRRLHAQGMELSTDEVLHAVLTDREVRAVKGGVQRFGVSSDRQLRWLERKKGKGGVPSASTPKAAKRQAPRVAGQPKRASNVSGVVEPDPGHGPAGQAVMSGRKVPASRTKMLRQLLKLTPHEFEALVSRLLEAMGMQEVTHTSYGGDAGIDARGVLVLEDVIRIRVAVQVKRFTKGNVQRPAVQSLRGSLSTGEVGWFFTTSDYSPGAREEARASDRQPISLLNGLEIADLVLKYSVPLTVEKENG